jgi:hypothetical protein
MSAEPGARERGSFAQQQSFYIRLTSHLIARCHHWIQSLFYTSPC